MCIATDALSFSDFNKSENTDVFVLEATPFRPQSRNSLQSTARPAVTVRVL
jgi:hypothetical protein